MQSRPATWPPETITGVHMKLSAIRLLALYLTGFFHVFMHVLVASMLLLWGMQIVAVLHGEVYNWSNVFVHLFLSLSFLAFYPNQQYWTYRLRGPDGAHYTIVGREQDRDEQNG